MGPHWPRCPKSGLLSTACSPFLQNHRHFPCGCSDSQRSDVDVCGARQELAPAADLSGNGKGVPTAPAPAQAQPGQHQPSIPPQLGWETVARDGAGRASTFSHPAFIPFHLRTEELGNTTGIVTPHWEDGAAGPRVPEQVMLGI